MITRMVTRKRTHIKSSNQHVIPLGNGWAVKKENDNDLFIITEKQQDAIKVARKLAQANGSDLIIHAKDGTIRDSYSYAQASGTTSKK